MASEVTGRGEIGASLQRPCATCSTSHQGRLAGVLFTGGRLPRLTWSRDLGRGGGAPPISWATKLCPQHVSSPHTTRCAPPLYEWFSTPQCEEVIGPLQCKPAPTVWTD
jgi:hypothetical protein